MTHFAPRLVTLIAAAGLATGLAAPAEATAVGSHCWSRLLEQHVEQRLVHHDGRDWAEFRTISTYRRHCAGAGKPQRITLATAWGPGRR